MTLIGKMALLKLIRWPNLVIIAFMQYLIRYAFTLSLNFPHALDDLHYFFGVLCSISLAAGGYIINDIYDLETDEINKPQRKVIGKKFTLAAAWQLYFGANIISLGSGYLVSKAAGMPNLWMLPLIAIAILYFYSISLKKIPLLGNITVSLLTALPVILVALFDLIPTIDIQNVEFVKSGVLVIAIYSLFAFWTNLIREIVKDAEDYEGDKLQGYKTLAVVLGTAKVKYVILSLVLALLAFTGYYNYVLFSGVDVNINSADVRSGIYVLIFINLPLLYLSFQLFKAQHSADFKKISTLLKFVMLTGVLSMAVFTYFFNLEQSI